MAFRSLMCLFNNSAYICIQTGSIIMNYYIFTLFNYISAWRVAICLNFIFKKMLTKPTPEITFVSDKFEL